MNFSSLIVHVIPMNCIKNKKSFFGKHNLKNEILLIFMSDAKLKAIPMNTWIYVKNEEGYKCLMLGGQILGPLKYP